MVKRKGTKPYDAGPPNKKQLTRPPATANVGRGLEPPPSTKVGRVLQQYRSYLVECDQGLKSFVATHWSEEDEKTYAEEKDGKASKTVKLPLEKGALSFHRHSDISDSRGPRPGRPLALGSLLGGCNEQRLDHF